MPRARNLKFEIRPDIHALITRPRAIDSSLAAFVRRMHNIAYVTSRASSARDTHHTMIKDATMILYSLIYARRGGEAFEYRSTHPSGQMH